MLTLQAWAQDQKPLVVFEENAFDFGAVAEEDGPVSHEFVFKNTGALPLVISDVKASCGCTTPSWTREPVQPGDSGRVIAEYDPRNRPGSFSKTISVTTNAEPALTVLHIKGSVEPKPKTPEDDYPTQMGSLRTVYRSFNMGKITTKEPVTKSFAVYNDSDSSIIFSSRTVAPGHIQIEAVPQELLPQQKGTLKITYDATAGKNLGFSSDHITLFTNEAEDSVKAFSVMATVEEYFAPMTQDELNRAPRLTFDSKKHDFGNIREDAIVKTDFIFTNTGKSLLHIRETKANCGCTVSKPAKDTLEPGESSKLTVTFNTKGRQGKQQKTVTVFSNDPTAPTQQINITAVVNASESEER